MTDVPNFEPLPTDEEIDALLNGPEPDWDAEPEPPADERAANGRLRALGQVRAERAVKAKLRDSLVLDLMAKIQPHLDEIERWWLEVDAALAKREGWLYRSVVMWHFAHFDPETMRGPVSLSLPAGDLTSRKEQPEWEYDIETFVEWAKKEKPDLLTWSEPVAKPVKNEVKKVLQIPGNPKWGEEVQPVTEDGEPVPGITVVIRPPKFEPRPNI